MGSAVTLFRTGGLLAAALVLLCASAAEATFPGQNGKLAYEGTVDGRYGVYGVNPDGSGTSLLVDGGAQPAWSPDGQAVAYIESSQPGGLYTTDAQGSVRTLVKQHLVDGTPYSYHATLYAEPAWSADGALIAYEMTQLGCFVHAGCLEGPLGIRAIRPDGGGDHEVLPPGATDPAYSPDGTQMAWEDHRFYEVQHIHVARADGTGNTVLTGAAADGEGSVDGEGGVDASWSPDGKRIAFARRIGDDQEIFVMNADGSGRTRLTSLPGADVGPVWSPDGTKIAWAHRPELWVMNADGSSQTRITAPGTYAANPDWQPLVGPRRADFKNQSKFCKAERDFLGEARFRERYGNHGGCASQRR